ncbi:MAG: hypothetical protein K8S13_06505 [Desulfobacula sp.]|uniref:hypothetical protein n=1 Tax=Desulfobacula sp. TaxID=2593537 RepID=UPI0025C510C1|nr:hypothetical protein [Desulfobacula sp.]MCD4719496.1 hypothetical protein [Desulfobacula sp.]
MPFQHIVDDNRDIVVLKSIGDVSVPDIMTEIKKAITTKRGDGITRRLIDMTDQKFSYDLEDAQKVLNAVQIEAKVLRPKKIAILFQEIPDSFDFDKIESLLNSPIVEIGIFIDKIKAIEFLNKGQQEKEDNNDPPKAVWTLNPQ